MQPDKEFLRDYIKDARAEMNWRREVEFRLLQYLLVFYPIIATAMVTLFQTPITRQVYWWLTIGASVFIVGASLFVTDRINREHKAYASIGKIVQKTWKYFALFEPGAYLKGEALLPETLLDPEKGFGQGKGHQKTLALIWIITAAILVLIFALAILKSP
jgi:hypothetical protein